LIQNPNRAGLSFSNYFKIKRGFSGKQENGKAEDIIPFQANMGLHQLLK